MKEKCVTANSSKQAELSVCTKNRAHHPIYRQIASISLLKAVAMAMAKLLNGLVCKKKRPNCICMWLLREGLSYSIGHRILLLGVSNHGNLLSSPPPVSNTWEGSIIIQK